MSPKETAADKPPLTKEAWLLEFRTEVERRRGLYNSKLVAVGPCTSGQASRRRPGEGRAGLGQTRRRQAMKAVEFWLSYINSERKPGKKFKTTWRMTEQQALERHPEAVRVPAHWRFGTSPKPRRRSWPSGLRGIRPFARARSAAAGGVGVQR